MSEDPELAGFDDAENSADDVASVDEDLADGVAPEESLDQLREQAEEAEQRALRAHAELENYRKRTQRTLEDERKYAALPLIRDLLPVLDNLSRAVSAADDEASNEGIVQGVQMVVSQLEALLGQYGCERIEAIGQPFDPNLHEAVGQQPHEATPANHISLEIQTGYRMHDRVVRAAQVYVSTGPAAPAESD